MPPEFTCGQGHGSRCWLLDPRAPDVTPPEGMGAAERRQ